MPALSAVDLLGVWEAGQGQAPIGWALALLAAAEPETPLDDLASLSIGSRDVRLLMLREQLWGRQMVAAVDCPRCRERLEMNLDTREILAQSGTTPPRELTLIVGEFTVNLRLPTSLDAIAAAAAGSLDSARALLLERCVLSAARAGSPIPQEQLPAHVAADIPQALVDADPLADIQFQLECPSCDHRWRALFDVVSFLWTELDAWSARIVRDVHTLARAYGWREHDILALSSSRRQLYLDMVGA